MSWLSKLMLLNSNFKQIKTNFNLIVAICDNNGIGKNGSLPWKFKNELKYFAKKTTGLQEEKNAIVMGRKTWESLPKKPLPNRDNYVVSSTLENKYSYNSFNTILQVCREKQYNNVWVIGGVSLYEYFLKHNLVDYLYITRIHKDYECDTFFPKNIPNKHFKLIDPRVDETLYTTDENTLYYQLITCKETYENNIQLDYCIYKKITNSYT